MKLLIQQARTYVMLYKVTNALHYKKRAIDSARLARYLVNLEMIKIMGYIE